MLLPYCIAALNIEHAYFERAGQYEPFEGLCFVDSLDLAEVRDAGFSFMTEANTQRVERQKKAPITVIVGNPPYNMGQQDENDNNKNREYPVIDDRLRQTYARTSSARLKNKLYDPYVKFFRWASDRLGAGPGIVCFITHNGFLGGIAFDGFRKALHSEFQTIYHFDFKGDARTSGELRRREGGNIFEDQIRVGVGVTLLVRNPRTSKNTISYHTVGDHWRAERKSGYVRSFATLSRVPWTALVPDARGTWLVPKDADTFASFLPIASQESKAQTGQAREGVIFARFSLGVVTSRDEWVYGPSADSLGQKVKALIKNYNHELFRLQAEESRPGDIGSFVNADPRLMKWTDRLKEALLSGERLKFTPDAIRPAIYRPYTKRMLYFDHLLNQRRYLQHYFFPTEKSECENAAITLTTLGSEKPFMTLNVKSVSDLHLVGAGSGSQCFPLYSYDADGSNRADNITDWALKLFRDQFADPKIAKWDIFHYVYSVLHHPGYREKFADNLKRELPRIPLAASRDDFRAFRDAGQYLAKLHVEYESVEPWPLKWIETPGVPLSYRVEKMKLSKDKKTLFVNDSLTLAGIPPEVFEYRLGNRSALEWVIDQYQVSTDKRSGITSDPNRPDDPEYIVRLVGQVIRVSMETVKIVNSLPEDYGGPPIAHDSTPAPNA
jgi:predicted helicase